MVVEPASPLRVAGQTVGDTVVVRVHGEVNMAAQPVLAGHLAEVSVVMPARLVVDLSGVSLIASAGLSLLAAQHQRCEREGGRLVIVAPGPRTRRPFVLTGLDQVLRLAPDLDTALRT